MRKKIDFRLIKDNIAQKTMFFLTIFSVLIVFLMIFGLFIKSKPILTAKSLHELLLSQSWHPLKEEFGFFPFIMGSIWVTLAALVIAIPFSLLTAIYLSEYSPKHLRETARPLIDLLAGIPSVVYGVWGILLIVPFVNHQLAALFKTYSSGYCILSGGIVLAVMISPIIIHVSMEVISSISYEIRETSLSLGATKWQTVKLVVLRKGSSGIIAAIVLALSRAFGETMAVLMVVGNVPVSPKSVFDPGYPLPALIANNYGEMMSVPLYDSALMLAALILLFVVLFFNILARLILIKLEKKSE